MTGRVHSFESFGAADGPGVRFVVFMHGCGFRCAYCHNPDTWASAGFTEATPDEVMAKALRYKAYWGTDGGITVSGGEPMLQPEFVAELFERAHAEGVATCLDTAAGPFREDDEKIRRMIDLTDTVLLDLKIMDPEKHRELTGADNAPVLACAKYLAAIKKPVWIRHVLVPGVTDGEGDLKRLGDFVRTLPNVVRTDILPYHTFGVEKWRRLNLPYRLSGVRPPDRAAVEMARKAASLGRILP